MTDRRDYNHVIYHNIYPLVTSPNGRTFDHLSIRRICFRPWIGRSPDWWVSPPPLSTRNSLGPKVRHLLKFNLSFQCSLVVHVFSMVFAMVIFCKVIFYYWPKLRHWLKLVFELIFFLLVNDFKSCLQWFYVVSLVPIVTLKSYSNLLHAMFINLSLVSAGVLFYC